MPVGLGFAKAKITGLFDLNGKKIIHNCVVHWRKRGFLHPSGCKNTGLKRVSLFQEVLRLLCIHEKTIDSMRKYLLEKMFKRLN